MKGFAKHYWNMWGWWFIALFFCFLFMFFPGLHLGGIGVIWLCLTCYLIALTIIGFIRLVFIRR